MARFAYGGQALMEGVLMRGKDAIGVAVRGPDGRIFGTQERLDSVLHRNRFARAPFFRGVVVLYETLVIGTRWLMRSGALAAAGEGVAMGGGTVAVTMAVTLVLAIGLFVLLPLLVAQGATATVLSGLLSSLGITGGLLSFLQHLIEAAVRIALFVGYLLVVSRSAEIRRVFQYHGAEHMTIHAWEAGDPLTVDRVRPYPTAHPRCGTEFLVIVILLSIVAFSLVGRQEVAVMIGSRVLLIPVIAAVGYELLKWAARRRGNPIVRALTYPGILVQMITTKRPTDDMIEVAIVSLEQALKADREALPDGANVLAREPLQMPGLPPSAIPGEVEAGLAAIRERDAAGAAARA